MKRGLISKKLAGIIVGIVLGIALIGNLFSDKTDDVNTSARAEVTSEITTVSDGEKDNPSEESGIDEKSTEPDTLAEDTTEATTEAHKTENQPFDIADIPGFSGSPYVKVNNNTPYFEKSEYTTDSFEKYATLDVLGRCGVAYACVGVDLMPTEERGSIGSVKPSGWHSVKYDCVDGKYLYNRCHLIGYQLSGENANNKNLITGTRYLNIEGMLPFENLIADYVKETKNHVLYRVTPIFEGDNLLATGVLMEGYSVEDEGDGINFCIFAYNAQPSIWIDYATGDSSLSSP